MAAAAQLNFFKCDYFITIKPLLTKHVDNIKYRLAVRKTANIYVKNYISLKRGVYRPDCTSKTAKIIFQNIHTRLKWIVFVSKGEENSMAYIQAFDRRLHSSL